ncbi:Agamous-like MADS-box protein AGL61-like protein [Drosera capensis]
MDRALNMSRTSLLPISIDSPIVVQHTQKSMLSDNLNNFPELGSFSDLLHLCNDLDSNAPLATLSIANNEFTAPMISDSAHDSSGVELVNRKFTRGRCKIPIAKIASKSKQHMAFSKRRAGLSKKASKICVLTGARIAIVTLSEAGKAFTFGNPSADSVISNYLQPNN